MQNSTQRAATASSTRDELTLQGRLTGPLLATYLAELGLFYIDHAIVGRLGADELGAVGLSGMVFIEVVLLGAAILSIVGVMVGNAYGAGDKEKAAQAVRVGMMLGVALSIPSIVLGWYLMDLLALTGQEPVIIELGEQYVRAAVWMVPPALGFVVLRSFVSSLSRPGIVTVVIVIALPLNFALDWVLVFGAFGIPGLGVTGAGYATAIVNWLMFFGLVVYIQADRVLRSYQVFSNMLVLDPDLTKRICRLGTPVAGMAFIESAFFNIMIITVGLFGVIALAANQIVINTFRLAWTIASALGEASAIRVSQENGSGSLRGAFRAGWVSIAAGLAVGLVFCLALVIAPGALASAFLDSTVPNFAEVLDLVRVLGLLGAVLVLLDTVQIVAARALRGLEDTFVPMVMSVIGYWVIALPAGFLLAFTFDYGVVGLWVGYTVGIGITCVLLLARWIGYTRRLARNVNL